MALLPIVTAPDKRLKEKALPVESVDDDLRTFMDDMLETMYDAPGIGLAATQVGVAKRVIVVDVEAGREGRAPNPLCLANPEIIASEGEIAWEEGCLSVPEQMAEVERAAWVRIRALNRDGEVVEFDADGLLAVCLQHEIDHLNGVLFIDHLSRLKRAMIVKKLKKIKSGAS
ncbi:MAG: peptide deformylase [Magnetococcales bacterium]|nr:peptide deformylase [Magnetococcales bacterium]